MQKLTRPYEVLVRLGKTESGTATVEAMHLMDLEVVVDDDGVTVIAARELAPRDITIADPEYGSLVTAIDAAMAADNASLKAANMALTAQLQDAKAALAAVTMERDAASAQQSSAVMGTDVGVAGVT